MFAEIGDSRAVSAFGEKWAEANNAAGMNRVMHAPVQMTKLDLATLQRAYDGN